MSGKQFLARNVSQKLNRLNLELTSPKETYDIELEYVFFEIFLPASLGGWSFNLNHLLFNVSLKINRLGGLMFGVTL